MTELTIVTLGEFVSTVEPGFEALLGSGDEQALLAAGGDCLFYGSAGSGKTTLAVDLGCHLAAGQEWLGIAVGRKLRVLLVELEGPRPAFRKKLARKRAAWRGERIGSNVRVLEAPWGALTLADEQHRAALAARIAELALDVVILGPVTRAGFDRPGTLAEVRDYMALVADVRARSGRPAVAFVLIHHEGRGGQVSGVFEGAVDTLLHVQGQGRGRTRLFVEKARWSSAHHGTALQLGWTDGEGFELVERDEASDEAIADELLGRALANGGASWNKIEDGVTGADPRKRAIRDALLAGGRLVNAGSPSAMKIWHADDPARPALQAELRPDGDAPGTHLAAVGP